MLFRLLCQLFNFYKDGRGLAAQGADKVCGELFGFMHVAANGAFPLGDGFFLRLGGFLLGNGNLNFLEVGSGVLAQGADVILGQGIP